MTAAIMRTCSVCKQTKPRNTAFSRIGQRGPAGRGTTYSDDCKVCRAAAKADALMLSEISKEERDMQKRATWEQRNRERVAEAQRKRRAKKRMPKVVGVVRDPSANAFSWAVFVQPVAGRPHDPYAASSRYEGMVV